MPDDRHLGDGVYASWDGYHIVLDLRGQDNYTRIALDPSVMHHLKQFDADCLKEQAGDELEQTAEEVEEAEAVAEDWDREMLGDDYLLLEDHDIGDK